MSETPIGDAVEAETTAMFELEPPAGTVLPDDTPSTEEDPAEVDADEPDPEDGTVLMEDALPGEDPPADEPAEG